MEKETSRPSVNLASDALNNQVCFCILYFFLYFVFPPVLLTTRFFGDENNLESTPLTITFFQFTKNGRGGLVEKKPLHFLSADDS